MIFINSVNSYSLTVCNKTNECCLVNEDNPLDVLEFFFYLPAVAEM